MVDVKKLEKGWPEVRRGVCFRWRSSRIPLEMVLWFGSISHLRGVFAEQMTSANEILEFRGSI